MARIFIACPQYRAMPLDEEKRLAKHFGFKDYRPFGLHPMVTKSLFLLNKVYGKVHYAELQILRNDGMIERSRSHLFGGWLKEWKKGNRFDYFMCLDEDVEFHPSAIQSMIDADKDIIGGEYAYKTTEGLNLGKSVCKYLPDEIPDENGILKIRWLNGGFIFCKAEALLKDDRAFSRALLRASRRFKRRYSRELCSVGCYGQEYRGRPGTIIGGLRLL